MERDGQQGTGPAPVAPEETTLPPLLSITRVRNIEYHLPRPKLTPLGVRHYG